LNFDFGYVYEERVHIVGICKRLKYSLSGLIVSPQDTRYGLMGYEKGRKMKQCKCCLSHWDTYCRLCT